MRCLGRYCHRDRGMGRSKTSTKSSSQPKAQDQPPSHRQDYPYVRGGEYGLGVACRQRNAGGDVCEPTNWTNLDLTWTLVALPFLYPSYSIKCVHNFTLILKVQPAIDLNRPKVLEPCIARMEI